MNNNDTKKKSRTSIFRWTRYYGYNTLVKTKTIIMK